MSRTRPMSSGCMATQCSWAIGRVGLVRLQHVGVSGVVLQRLVTTYPNPRPIRSRELLVCLCARLAWDMGRSVVPGIMVMPLAAPLPMARRDVM
jgi:hypothetical protein